MASGISTDADFSTFGEKKSEHLFSVPDIKCKDPLDKKFTDHDENNALQLAAANGHEDTVEFLLSRGFSVNHTNKYGWTPLMQAARGGHTATVEMLVKKGANVTIKNKLGITALECAVRSGHLSTVKAIAEEASLADTEAALTPLMVAAQSGHNSIVRLLLDAKVDVNKAKSGTGLTALMLASFTGHDNTARLLVEHGADVMATSIVGMTALDMAAERGKRHVSCFLIQQMSLIKKTESETMEHKLFDAIHQGDVNQVAAIIKINRKIVHCVDKVDGQTPLIRAVTIGHTDMVTFIVNSGADIDQSDNYGFNPLMQAIFCGHNDLAMYLMGAGADVNFHQRDKCQFNPFDVATLVDQPNSEVVNALVELMGFSSGSTRKSKSETDLRKKWWDRISKKINKRRILTRTDSGSPNSTDAQFHHTVIRLPSKDPSPTLLRTNPRHSVLLSDNLPVVVSPLVPCYGLDSSTSSRYGMPPGIRNIGLNDNNGKKNQENLKQKFSLTGRSTKEAASTRERSNTLVNVVPVDLLAQHLQESSLDQYLNLFRESEIDLEAFSLLTEPDLLEMEIYDAHSRNRILESVAKLKTKGSCNMKLNVQCLPKNK